jgi:hypothetical protein
MKCILQYKARTQYFAGYQSFEEYIPGVLDIDESVLCHVGHPVTIVVESDGK